jgi:tyrosyl-tRNA synthetase
VLLGGGTTKIGDPSGKDTQRQMLTVETIAANKASISTAFTRLLSDKGENRYLPVDNADWLDQLNYIQMLREVAPHFSVNRMLTMDSVRLRLEREQPLSFLEFNYMILQAYDFAQLHRNQGVRIQMGGSDQWGNIIQGVELNRRLGQKEVFGATMNLITTASGAKMGKTAAGAVWLNADMRSPYEYWQFWRNTEDGDVTRFLKLYTELSVYDNAALGAGNINDAKKVLATEATVLMHGRDEAEKAAKTAADIFSGAGVSENMPEITVEADTALFAAVVTAGFAASNGEARRLIKGNGVRVNDVAVADDNRKLAASDLTTDGFIKLSAGKKRHVLVRFA